MQPIASTAEILCLYIQNETPGDVFVQWALDMMEAGFETEHLIILAGETKPYEYFHMHPLVSNVLKELQLDALTDEEIINSYACYLVNEALSGRKSYQSALNSLAKSCEAFDYTCNLYDFYLLYYANLDLKEYGDQWYWPGDTRENIDAIIKQHFIQWQAANCESIYK